MALGTVVVGSKTIGLMIPTPLRTIASLQTEQIFGINTGAIHGVKSLDGVGTAIVDVPFPSFNGSAYRFPYDVSLCTNGDITMIGEVGSGWFLGRYSNAGAIVFEVLLPDTTIRYAHCEGGPGGDIYIGKYGFGHLERFDGSTGAYVTSYDVSVNTGNNILAMTANDTNIFTVQANGNDDMISKFDLSGNLVLGHQDNYNGVATRHYQILVANDGNLLATCYANTPSKRSFVRKINVGTMTTMMETDVELGGDPEHLVELSTGEILIWVSTDVLVRYNAAGVHQATTSSYLGSGSRDTMAVGKDDFIYHAFDENTMYKVDPITGGVVDTFSGTGILRLVGV